MTDSILPDGSYISIRRPKRVVFDGVVIDAVHRQIRLFLSNHQRAGKQVDVSITQHLVRDLGRLNRQTG